ncbi:MAG: YchJ family metal-binding protein [Chlamydiales bacterium]|nr:YchJ family metal-binding protein [Chlamydiales bacterium]
MLLANNNQEMLCPCRSGNTYVNCCKPFHQGQLLHTALELMRSRYSAYALHMPEYIIHTTHSTGPQFHPDLTQWSQKISKFCLNTEFKNLEILHFEEKGSCATVTFTAHLIQNQKDASFTEKSYFKKIEGKWLYYDAQPSVNA